MDNRTNAIKQDFYSYHDDSKQDTLIAGTNIIIENDVISVGNNRSLSQSAQSIEQETIHMNDRTRATKQDIYDYHDSTKQNKLIAGENITIDSNNVISATGGGGTQPQLYPPTIIGGINSIAWENNDANGDFPATITADVDGTPVTSPLTITEQMNGSVLTITVSATNFQSVTTQIILSYIQTSNSLLAVDVSGRAQYVTEYMSIGSDGNADVGKFVLDGDEAIKGSALITARGQAASGTLTSDFCFVATADGTINVRKYYGRSSIPTGGCLFELQRMTFDDYTMQFYNEINANVSIYDVTSDELIGTWNVRGAGSVSSSTITQLTVEANHVYTFIINATITALE